MTATYLARLGMTLANAENQRYFILLSSTPYKHPTQAAQKKAKRR